MSKSDFPSEFKNEVNNLGIDFDGVIHDDYLGFHDGTIYGDLIPGSKESLELLAKNYKLIIFTAKAKPSRPLVNGKTGIELIWEWLSKNGLSHLISEVTAEKPRAFAYIDDKAIRFSNWQATIDFLVKMEKQD
jgi:hypothetical protein